jgi:hypothetical protein
MMWRRNDIGEIVFPPGFHVKTKMGSDVLKIWIRQARCEGV